MLVSLTTEDAVLTAIGTQADPQDSATDVDYEQADIFGDYRNNQLWVNPIRNDRLKLLKDLYRNTALFNIVTVFKGGPNPNIDTIKQQLGTLNSAWTKTIRAKLVADPTFGGVCRGSSVEAVVNDGGYNSSDDTYPKAITIVALVVEYYSVD